MSVENALETVDVKLEQMYGVVPEVMRDLFHRLPFGQQITLSSGRTGAFKVFIEPRMGDEGRYEFGVDFVFDDGGSPDHLEFFMSHTGGGGAV